MKAAVLDINGKLAIQDIRKPEIPEYGCLVKMCYGSTCAGTDARLMRKQHPNPVYYPAVLGHESVGRIVEVNEKVRNFKVGDLITRTGTIPQDGIGVCWGGFAQYGIALDWQAMQQDGIPEEKWTKNRINKVIPEDIDEKTGPMIITWRETLSYYNRLKINEGANVLVCGSGANSLSFVAHSVYNKNRVVLIGNPSRGQDALDLGAIAIVDYHSENILEQLKELFPEGIDAIIDGVGADSNVNIALPLIKENGILGVYGWNNRVSYGINPFKTTKNFRVYTAGYDEPETHDEVIKRIREGKLDASYWYDMDNPIPLQQLQSAYDRLAKREAYKFLIDLN